MTQRLGGSTDDLSVARTPQVRYALARFGTFYWIVPDRKVALDKLGQRTLVEAFKAALLKDPRVSDARLMEFPSDRFGSLTSAFPTGHAHHEDLLTGRDLSSVLSLVGLLLFSIRVHRKDQPSHLGKSDFPTEEYRVAWDGTTAFVAWVQDTDVAPVAGVTW